MKDFKIFLVMLIIPAAFSCKKAPAISAVQDSDLSLRIMKIKNSPDDKEASNYAVRLSPDKRLLAAKDNKLATDLWYRMDSCFYLQTGNQKIYATIIQPIANGITGTFEYYVSFETTEVSAGKPELVYADRYINHKKYKLSLPE